MISFTTTIQQFGENGDKTGWTYIEIPADVAEQLQPGSRKAFRVKGFLDEYAFSGISLLPFGNGHFLMALNASIRKGIGKRKGAMLQVRIEADKEMWEIPSYVKECMEDEPAALDFFLSLPRGHQRYFVTWIESAKTESTRTKRLAQMVTALAKKWGYGEMIRANRATE